MEDKFVVRPKATDKKEEKSVVLTLRMDRELREEFDTLSAKSDRSRNELMCRALRYALEHLEFTCTKIIIAQRISSTRKADKILVLKDGKIEEEGTHEELIAKKGYYYELVKLQGGEELLATQQIRTLEGGVQHG